MPVADQCVDACDELGCPLDERVGPLEDQATVLGRFDARGGAYEDFDAEFVLDATHARADGLLAESKAAGGGAHAAESADRDDDLQRCDVGKAACGHGDDVRQRLVWSQA
ncbi:Uncharacterised protein [Mycobacteroides abscessus subsp. abscessus]|nr:Uncharacterised protein [Mycobacteroides abscessus subsp. abscessus]